MHARDAVVVTEYAPDGEPRIVLVNPAFCAQTGYEADEVLGQHPRLLVGPDTDLSAQLALRRATEDGVPATVELVHYRKDGSAFWVENSVNPVTNDGIIIILCMSHTTESARSIKSAGISARKGEV